MLTNSGGTQGKQSISQFAGEIDWTRPKTPLSAPGTQSMGDHGVPQAVEEDKYAYIIDKGPVGAITSAPEGASKDCVNYFSFRAFGLPQAQAVHAGIPGHYIVNMDALAVSDDPSTQVFELPALVNFKDPGSPAMFALNFKAASNGKLYVCCIPTVLKTKPDPDKDYTHIGDKDIRLFRLDLVKDIANIVDQNGQPLRKNFNAWLKEGHSATLKRLKLRNILDFKVRMRPSSFIKNVHEVVSHWSEELRKESVADCGEAATNSDLARSTVEIREAHETVQSKVTELVGQVKANLLQHVQDLAVSLGFRIVEVGCSEPVTDDLIHTWLDKSCAPNHITQLMETLKNSGIIDRLKSLTAESTPLVSNSPIKPATPPAAEAADIEPVETEIPLNDMSLRTKRKQPDRFDSAVETPTPAATNSTDSTSGAWSSSMTGGSSSQSGNESKRSYIKSGKYAKGGINRAQQMADVNHTKGPKGSRGPKGANDSAKPLNAGACAHAPTPQPLPTSIPNSIPNLNCRGRFGTERDPEGEGVDDQAIAEASGSKRQRVLCQSEDS